MPRVRSQLAIQADPALLKRLGAHAKTTGRTTTALVVEGIEAVERRLQQLESAPPAPVRSSSPASCPGQ
jgi:predicted DNA-binding protein